MLQALHRWIKSMGLTFVLGFLLCIFQSSESILVKLSNNRPDPHPSSAKLLLLSEFLKLLISYTLLSVERKQLVGLTSIFRRRCCRSGKTCCRSGKSSAPLQDDEEQQMQRGKRLLDNQDNDDDEDDEDDVVSPTTPNFTSTSSSYNIPPILFFAVPGAIYFFNNNLSFILLELMPAPTYVVLSNLKILTTGLFSYLFLHRLLTKPQWVSLGILFFSTAVSQVDLEKGLSLSISIQAFLLMILFCSLSAAASVFSEYVMKERFATESIHLQNMKLYMFGILFNGITYMLTPPAIPHGAPPTPGTPPPPPPGFFSDMAFLHFTIVLAYASLGLVTSAIIKFSGSITKVYASSMSMFFAALVSWLFLNDQLTILFFVGCFGCCYALHLYYRVVPTPSAETITTTTTTTTTTAAEDTTTDKTKEDVRRDSASSSTSSTTLAVSSPVSKDTSSSVKAAGSQHPMTSVRVVDRHEYLSLDTLDHDDDDGDDEEQTTKGGRRSSVDRR
ncbi:hypothetical protein BGZ97_001631 [Linnemannia gamsii]|uniref:Nucleotide-sugar transporter n=1 Tax=Linnemannia gamsii TaxID=64522 RepID=A0A9P6UUF6_9FUNG|nr:hypothetical protein BGZ97_001631 [Linnemannia gamsii]